MAAVVPSSPFPAAGRDQLILRYAPLVRRAVGQFAGTRVANLDPEDIYGYGTLGLIDAIDRFDPTQGVKFETYAITRIRGYLLDQLRALDWLPRSARTRVRLVQRAGERLEARLGRYPSYEELAHETGLDPDACQRVLAEGNRYVLSLDTLLAADEDGAAVFLVERLEDERGDCPDQASEQAEMQGTVATALDHLPSREATLLRLHYGQEWSLKRIAECWGLSESRVSQLHTQALNHMRQALTGEIAQHQRVA